MGISDITNLKKEIEDRLNKILEMGYCQTELKELDELKRMVKKLLREFID
jgi:hypothetical protein